MVKNDAIDLADWPTFERLVAKAPPRQNKRQSMPAQKVNGRQQSRFASYATKS